MRRFFSQRALFALHGILGVKFCILLTVICLTGSLATVSHEIDWLINPVMRVEARPEPNVSWGRLHAAVQEAHPGWQVSWMSTPLYENFAAEVVATTPEGQWRRVYVDPFTGTVQGHTSYLNVQRFLRSLHMGLFLPVVGLYLVSFFGFVMLVSLITGLVIYKKFWRGFFRLPRTNRGARVFWGDLHKFAGLWSVWFTAIIAGTGIWYFVEMAMYDLDASLERPDPKIAEEVLARLGPEPPRRLRLDELVGMAQAAFPDLDIRRIYLPAEPRDALRIEGQTGAVLVRDRANRILLNPYDGSVIDILRADQMGVARRWVDTADELHFGTFGGLATKILYLVFGLVLTGMILSGSWLWLRRALKQPQPARAPAGRLDLARTGSAG